MIGLVVPEIYRAGLTSGNNALQAEMPGFEQVLAPFLGQLSRDAGKKAVDLGDDTP